MQVSGSSSKRGGDRQGSAAASSHLPLTTAAWFVLSGMCLVASFVCLAPGGDSANGWLWKGIIMALLACGSFICGSMGWPADASHTPYVAPSPYRATDPQVDWWSVSSTLNVASLLVLCGVLLSGALITATFCAGGGAWYLFYTGALFGAACLAMGSAEGIWQVMQVVVLAEKAITRGALIDESIDSTILWYPASDDAIPSKASSAAGSAESDQVRYWSSTPGAS